MQTKRLDKVEDSLTPKQAALLWLREANQHPDSSAYGRTLKGQPVSAYPLSVMERQMKASVWASMKGEKREAIEHAIVQAQRDGLFLFKVATTANKEWYEHERALEFGRLALVYLLGLLLEHKVDVLKSKPNPHDLAEFLGQARLFVRLMNDLHAETLILRRAFATLGERYFAGERLLYAQGAADLDELALRMGEIASLYNGAVGDVLASEHPELVVMTAAEIEAMYGDAVAETVAYLVDRAKAEALTLCGEVNAAADVMAKHV